MAETSGQSNEKQALTDAVTPPSDPSEFSKRSQVLPMVVVSTNFVPPDPSQPVAQPSNNVDTGNSE